MSSSNVPTTKRRAQIACTNCRERKVKCEHENSETCKRCAASSKECHYEPVSMDKALSSSPYRSPSMDHTSTAQDGGYLVEGVRAPPSLPAQSTYPQMPVAAAHNQQTLMFTPQYPTYPQAQAQAQNTQYPSTTQIDQGATYSPAYSLPQYPVSAQTPMAVPASSQLWQPPQTQYTSSYAPASNMQQMQQGQPQNWPINQQPVVDPQTGYPYSMHPNAFNQQRPHEGGR